MENKHSFTALFRITNIEYPFKKSKSKGQFKTIIIEKEIKKQHSKL